MTAVRLAIFWNDMLIFIHMLVFIYLSLLVLMKNQYNSLTVVIPTLNESGTIRTLIKEIISSYQGVRILVVDDGSRDGTLEMVSRIAKRQRRVSLINRKALRRRSGLTASVLDGISSSKTSLVIVMDGDMQHPHGLIGTVVKALDTADLAICVRSRIENWPFHRRVVSWIAVQSGLLVLSARGKRRSRDIMSGFFGVRRTLFMKVYNSNRKRFVAEGFKVLFDFLKSADGSITIKELPYTFKDREHGASNAKLKHGFYLFKSFLK